MKTAYSITELNQQTLCQTLIQANKISSRNKRRNSIKIYRITREIHLIFRQKAQDNLKVWISKWKNNLKIHFI